MGKVRRNLRFSFIDGAFYAVMFGLGDTYLNPYAVALGATPLEIGLLLSVPVLASSLLQYKAAEVTRAFGRRRTILIFVMLQGLTWLPIMLVPWLFTSHRPLWLVLFATAYAAFLSLATPAWYSIITQYIPVKRRGAYFSFRTKWLNAVTLTAGFLGGFVLWLFRRESLGGFMCLFAMALVCRLASWSFLRRMDEPRLGGGGGADFSFGAFIARWRESNFVKFTFFAALFSAATYLSAPYFPAYMLRELHFSYLAYVTVNTTLALFGLLSLSSWGRHADHIGNLSVIRLTGLIIAAVPALWMASVNFVYILLVNALAGFAWAGFNLAIYNFIFDASSEAKRVRCFSYFTLVNGVGIFFGAIIGGAIIPHLPSVSGSRMLTVFALSSLARFLVWSLCLPRIREVRRVDAVSKRDLFFSVLGVRELGPAEDQRGVE